VLDYKYKLSCDIKCQDNLAAAIRLSPDGHFLYVSQRGEDCVSVFSLTDNGASAEWINNIPCYGKGPRDIFITPDGKFLLCANEKSGDVTVITIKDGYIAELTDKVPLPSALCVYAE
jgi:6-phosphogluconolactonase (cycloisomerase 2 family)